jgi:hypothetical protein
MKKHYILLCLNEPNWAEIKNPADEAREQWDGLKKHLRDEANKNKTLGIIALGQPVWLIPRNKEGLAFVAECISNLKLRVKNQEAHKYEVWFLDESVETRGDTPLNHGSKTAK